MQSTILTKVISNSSPIRASVLLKKAKEANIDIAFDKIINKTHSWINVINEQNDDDDDYDNNEK